MKRAIAIALLAFGATACGDQTSDYNVTPIKGQPCVVVVHTESNGWTSSERDPNETDISGEYCKEGK